MVLPSQRQWDVILRAGLVWISYRCDKKRSYLKKRVAGGEGGIRTPDRSVSPYNGLANRRLQPLGHLSGGLRLFLLYQCFWFVRSAQNEIASRLMPESAVRSRPHARTGWLMLERILCPRSLRLYGFCRSTASCSMAFSNPRSAYPET